MWGNIMGCYFNFFIYLFSHQWHEELLETSLRDRLSDLQEMPHRFLLYGKWRLFWRGSKSKMLLKLLIIIIQILWNFLQNKNVLLIFASSLIFSGLFSYLFGIKFSNVYDVIGCEMQSPRKSKCIQIILLSISIQI